MRPHWLAIFVAFFLLSVGVAQGTGPHEVQSSEAEEVPEWVNDGWIMYPSIDNGTDDLASPLPIVVFFADDGRNARDYEWVGKGLAENGIVVIIIDWSESTSPKRMANDILEMVNDTELMLGKDANITLAQNVLLAGHGVGAGIACSLSDSSLFESGELTDHQIGAVFGLGTMAPPDGLDWSPSSGPTLGFEIHLIGTVDEEVDLPSLVSSRLSVLSTGHHLAEVLGANHVQYLEDPSFFDEFGDGDSTISLEVQHEHAMSRLVPFAELVGGRAPTDSWLGATARSDVMSGPSDPSSYTSEKIIGTKLTASSTRLPYEVVLNHDDFIDVDIDLSHLGGFPVNDAIVSVCLANAFECSQPLTTMFDSNQISLEITGPASMLPPGSNELVLLVLVDGVPHTLPFAFDRSDTPTRALDGIMIEIEQRGSATISAKQVAEDPDGQNMTISSSEWLNGSFDLIEPAIVDGILTLTHVGDDTSVGEHHLRLSVMTGASPAISSDVLVRVIEKDEPVQCSSPEVWHIIEDGAPISFNLASVCTDPEGVPLVIESSSNGPKVAVDVVGSELFLASAENAYGLETLLLTLSDGTTESVSLTIPIHIEATPDAPSSPSIITIDLIEDELETVDLDNIVSHPDGANWTVEITSGDTGVTAEVSGHVIHLRTVQDHDMDVSGWGLNLISDNGTTSVELILKVMPVNDAPIATIVRAEETVLGPQVTVIITDSDGPYPMHLVVVDGVVQHSFTLTCMNEVHGTESECDTYLVGGLDGEIFSATVVDDLGASSEMFSFSVVMDVTENNTASSQEEVIPSFGVIAMVFTLILATGFRTLSSDLTTRLRSNE